MDGRLRRPGGCGLEVDGLLSKWTVPAEVWMVHFSNRASRPDFVTVRSRSVTVRISSRTVRKPVATVWTESGSVRNSRRTARKSVAAVHNSRGTVRKSVAGAHV